LWPGGGARLCLQDQPQQVENVGVFGLLRLVLRTQPPAGELLQPALGLQ